MNTQGSGDPRHVTAMRPVDQPLVSPPGLLLEALQRHFWMIPAMCVLMLTGAYAYLRWTPPLYTSSALIYVEQKTPKVVREDEQGIMTQSDNYRYTQIAVLRSAPVLLKAAASLNKASLHTLADANDPMSPLRAHLTAEVGPMDGIISLSFKSPYPEEAATITNAVVDAYIDFHNERKRQEALVLLDILQAQRKQSDIEVARKYEQMQEFRRQHRNLQFGADLDNNIAARQMEAALAQWTSAKAAVSQSESFYERARGMAPDAAALRELMAAHQGRDVEAVDTQALATLRQELADREGQKADILRKVEPIHPIIAALDASITQIQTRITELNAHLTQRLLAVAQEECLAAREKEQELARRYEARQQQVLELSTQQFEYAVLQSDYERAKKQIDLLEERTKELNISGKVGGLTVAILERAGIAATPSEPQATKIWATALFFGVFAGTGLALVREMVDKRIRSVQEVTALLRLPVLGVIPRMRSSVRDSRLRTQTMRLNPISPEAEAFRRLRAQLLLGLPNDKTKTILVTSPASRDGKTLVTSNLALAMAQAGKRVLIVDADCRAPEQHENFQKDRQRKGLSSVLAGEMTLENAIESTGTPNLDILTCGPDLPNTIEILGGERSGAIVAALTKEYDSVLIDSPPVLCCSDAQVLAAHCNSVVLVLRADTSTRMDSLQACGELIAVNAHILGVVVNAVSRKCDYYHRYPHDGSTGHEALSLPELPVARGSDSAPGPWHSEILPP